jgi:integrase
VLPADRKAYVTAADARRLIDAANPIWRVIVALARYGGLRCPSEVLSLKWEHVDFAARRMTIPSPKTDRIPGKEYRPCPIFSELAPHLTEAFELAEPGEVYVVGGPAGVRYRAAANGKNGWLSANLRAEFEKLIRRAGLVQWPRVFHTLRASAETDLLERFPISAVTTRLGHSAAVALKHYTRVPDHLFDQAAGVRAESGAVPVQKPGQHTAAPARTGLNEPAEPPRNEAIFRINAGRCGSVLGPGPVLSVSSGRKPIGGVRRRAERPARVPGVDATGGVT